MLQKAGTRVLRARALPPGPDAVHTGAEQVRYAAARVRHASTLQSRETISQIKKEIIYRHTHARTHTHLRVYKDTQ